VRHNIGSYFKAEAENDSHAANRFAKAYCALLLDGERLHIPSDEIQTRSF